MGRRVAVLLTIAAVAVATLSVVPAGHRGQGHLLTASAVRLVLRAPGSAHISSSLQRLLDTFLANPPTTRLSRPSILNAVPSVIGPRPRVRPTPLRGYSCPVRGSASPCGRRARTVFVSALG